MKKFKLMGNSLIIIDGAASPQVFVRGDSYADVIEYIESNAGWITDDYNNRAFKVAYIEEIVE